MKLHPILHGFHMGILLWERRSNGYQTCLIMPNFSEQTMRNVAKIQLKKVISVNINRENVYYV